MNIEVINPIKYPSWNDQVSRAEGSTIFHTGNWAKVLLEAYGYEPRYFCAMDHGALTDIAPLMEINSPITGRRGVALPFSDQVEPLVKELGNFSDLLDAMISFGQSKKWRSITFHGGNHLLQNEKPFTSFISSFIEIDESESDLFEQLKSSTRRNIRKAQKSGLSTKIVRTKEGIEAFYKLNCLSRKDHGLPPQPAYFFEAIGNHVIAEGNGFVCLTLLDNRPIAGVVFFYFNNKAMYKYGASDKQFWHLRPNDLSMWEAIKWCAQNGIRYIDLGRTDPDQIGLLQFKRNWNSTEKMLHYYKYDLSKRSFISDDPQIKTSYSFFKKLPMPVLKGIGWLLYKHMA